MLSIFDFGKDIYVPTKRKGLFHMRFFFTFGTSDDYPFYGGWVEVFADTRETAIEKFRTKYPDLHENTVNCAFIYSEAEWNKTSMAKYGSNQGFGCQDVIR